MRYAIVRNGKVENVTEWDGVTPWQVEGDVVLSESANIGDLWDGLTFTKGNPPQTPESYTTEELVALAQSVTSLAQARAVLAIFAKGLRGVQK